MHLPSQQHLYHIDSIGQPSNFKQGFIVEEQVTWAYKYSCVFTPRFSDDNVERYSKQCIGR